MVRYEVGMFNQRKEAFEKELFKDFGDNGQEVNGPVRGELVRRFARLRDEY
jgi:hypothetical protein